MRKARKLPFGVSREGMPVETGQWYRSTPSTATVIIWLFLSTVMSTFAWAEWPANNISPASATKVKRILLLASRPDFPAVLSRPRFQYALNPGLVPATGGGILDVSRQRGRRLGSRAELFARGAKMNGALGK